QHVPDRLLRTVVIRAHQPIAHRIDAGLRVPVLDQSAELRPARLTLHCLLIEYPKQQRPPAAEEHCAVIELNAQHVRGCDRPRECHEVVTELACARAEVVLGAEAREIPTDELQLAGIARDAGVGRPQTPERWIHHPWMLGHRGPWPAGARASAARLCGDAAEDGPGDVAFAVA